MTSLVELNPFDALPIGCMLPDTNFYTHYLLVTLVPLVVVVFLGILGCRKPHTRHIIDTAMLTVVFLMYPSTTQTSFRMFKCTELDIGGDHELRRYLRTDMSIDCDSKEHRWMQCYAGSIIGGYTFGFPLWLSYLFFRRHRATLLHLARMEETRRMERDILKLKQLDRRASTPDRSHSRPHVRFFKWFHQQQHEVRHRLRMLAGTPHPQQPVRGEATGTDGGEVSRVQEMHHRSKTLKSLHKADEDSLPLVVRTLVHGYAFHSYWYELVECFRKVLNDTTSLLYPSCTPHLCVLPHHLQYSQATVHICCVHRVSWRPLFLPRSPLSPTHPTPPTPSLPPLTQVVFVALPVLYEENSIHGLLINMVLCFIMVSTLLVVQPYYDFTDTRVAQLCCA